MENVRKRKSDNNMDPVSETSKVAKSQNGLPLKLSSSAMRRMRKRKMQNALINNTENASQDEKYSDQSDSDASTIISTNSLSPEQPFTKALKRSLSPQQSMSKGWSKAAKSYLSPEDPWSKAARSTLTFWGSDANSLARKTVCKTAHATKCDDSIGLSLDVAVKTEQDFCYNENSNDSVNTTVLIEDQQCDKANETLSENQEANDVKPNADTLHLISIKPEPVANDNQTTQADTNPLISNNTVKDELNNIDSNQIKQELTDTGNNMRIDKENRDINDGNIIYNAIKDILSNFDISILKQELETVETQVDKDLRSVALSNKNVSTEATSPHSTNNDSNIQTAQLNSTNKNTGLSEIQKFINLLSSKNINSPALSKTVHDGDTSINSSVTSRNITDAEKSEELNKRNSSVCKTTNPVNEANKPRAKTKSVNKESESAGSVNSSAKIYESTTNRDKSINSSEKSKNKNNAQKAVLNERNSSECTTAGSETESNKTSAKTKSVNKNIEYNEIQKLINLLSSENADSSAKIPETSSDNKSINSIVTSGNVNNAEKSELNERNSSVCKTADSINESIKPNTKTKSAFKKTVGLSDGENLIDILSSENADSSAKIPETSSDNKSITFGNVNNAEKSELNERNSSVCKTANSINESNKPNAKIKSTNKNTVGLSDKENLIDMLSSENVTSSANISKSKNSSVTSKNLNNAEKSDELNERNFSVCKTTKTVNQSNKLSAKTKSTNKNTRLSDKEKLIKLLSSENVISSANVFCPDKDKSINSLVASEKINVHNAEKSELNERNSSVWKTAYSVNESNKPSTKIKSANKNTRLSDTEKLIKLLSSDNVKSSANISKTSHDRDKAINYSVKSKNVNNVEESKNLNERNSSLRKSAKPVNESNKPRGKSANKNRRLSDREKLINLLSSENDDSSSHISETFRDKSRNVNNAEKFELNERKYSACKTAGSVNESNKPSAQNKSANKISGTSNKGLRNIPQELREFSKSVPCTCKRSTDKDKNRKDRQKTTSTESIKVSEIDTNVSSVTGSSVTQEVDESDENHCKILYFKNLTKEQNLLHILEQRIYKANKEDGDNKDVKIQIIREGVQFEPKGEAFAFIPTHEEAVHICKKINETETKTDNTENVDVSLDIGYKMLKKYLECKCRNINRTKPKLPNVNKKEAELVSKKYIEELVDAFFDRGFFQEEDLISDPDDFGFRPQYLEKMCLKLPLSSSIIVMHLNELVDEDKLYEVFSLAGDIKQLTFDKELRKARIDYDHPVEAVQALNMFQGQKLFGKDIEMHMDNTRNPRPLPLGLSGVGKGFGKNGQPLKGVRAKMELNTIHEILYELKKMNKYKSTDINAPFTARYGRHNIYTKPAISEPSPDTSNINGPKDLHEVRNHIHRNQVLSNNTRAVQALGTILMARGILPAGVDCKDAKNILASLRVENQKSTQITTQNTATKSQISFFNYNTRPIMNPAASKTIVKCQIPVANKRKRKRNKKGQNTLFNSPVLPPRVPLLPIPITKPNYNCIPNLPLPANPMIPMNVPPDSMQILPLPANSHREIQIPGNLIEPPCSGQPQFPGNYMEPSGSKPQYPGFYVESCNGQSQLPGNYMEECGTMSPEDYTSDAIVEKECIKTTHRLIFKNLPPSLTKEALSSKMREVDGLLCGEISASGSAIVSFKTTSEANRCYRIFNKSKLHGRIINVDFTFFDDEDDVVIVE